VKKDESLPEGLPLQGIGWFSQVLFIRYIGMTETDVAMVTKNITLVAEKDPLHLQMRIVTIARAPPIVKSLPYLPVKTNSLHP